MKTKSFINSKGQVVTIEAIEVVDTRKLDANAENFLMFEALMKQAQELQIKIDYKPTLAVYKREDNN